MGVTVTESVPDIVETAASLQRPEPSDVRYSREAWAEVLKPLSADEARTARTQCDDAFLRDVFGGVAAVKTEDDELLVDVLDIRQENDRPIRRVTNRAMSTLQCLPLVSASLLCGWVQHLSVYERRYYRQNVRTSNGYYDPNEHYIEIGSDSSDPSGRWPRYNDYDWDARPEYSTTIHELGHALHYMNGAQVRNPDTLDNNERDDLRLAIRQDVERNEWQQAFLWDGIEGYLNVWQERYDSLRALSKYQRKTLEEFYAIAFEAWVTAPSVLFEEQPIAWRAFQRLP